MIRRIAYGSWLIVATGLLLEVGLQITARLQPSVLLTRVNEKVEELVKAKMRPRGYFNLGFPANSQGFNDEEFGAKKASVLRVVSISDSFAWLAVPHHYHFTTLVERALPATEVLNLGFEATGVDVYVYLLEAHALALEPDLIVVNIFVGNDLTGDLPTNLETGLPGWFDSEQWLVVQVPKRLARLAQERWRRESAPQYDKWSKSGVPTFRLEAAFPWLKDPFLEPPTFSRKRFVEVEALRLRAIDNRLRYSNWHVEFFGRIENMIRIAGDTPILFTIIPDEFQIEDALWEELQEIVEIERPRDFAQNLLRAWFDENDVPYLDLLEIFRGAPPLRDGNRHLFHFLDTHLNRRGSEIFGRSLAQRISQMDQRNLSTPMRHSVS